MDAHVKLMEEIVAAFNENRLNSLRIFCEEYIRVMANRGNVKAFYAAKELQQLILNKIHMNDT